MTLDLPKSFDAWTSSCHQLWPVQPSPPLEKKKRLSSCDVSNYTCCFVGHRMNIVSFLSTATLPLEAPEGDDCIQVQIRSFLTRMDDVDD